MRSCFVGSFASAILSIALAGLPLGAAAETRQTPEAAIRAALEKWTADFNAGRADDVCDLFSSELRYDFRGHPERKYQDICSILHRSLEDGTRKYAYALQIKEILVWGEVAVVRLVWTLRMTPISPPGSSVESIEPGMDIFRKQADGSWKVIRYVAYEE